jgi:regulator of replication initiation timing
MSSTNKKILSLTEAVVQYETDAMAIMKDEIKQLKTQVEDLKKENHRLQLSTVKSNGYSFLDEELF